MKMQDNQEEMSIDYRYRQILKMKPKNQIKLEEEIEIEDSSQPIDSKRRKADTQSGDINYKTYTEEFDEIIKGRRS